MQNKELILSDPLLNHFFRIVEAHYHSYLPAYLLTCLPAYLLTCLPRQVVLLLLLLLPTPVTLTRGLPSSASGAQKSPLRSTTDTVTLSWLPSILASSEMQMKMQMQMHQYGGGWEVSNTDTVMAHTVSEWRVHSLHTIASTCHVMFIQGHEAHKHANR